MARVITRWRVVRLIGVALVILALVGPWWYDRINVPAEFECQSPNIRLYGDFCGTPMAGIWLIAELIRVVPLLVQHTYSGTIGARDIGGLLLWFAISLVTIAPIISLVLRLKNRQTRGAWIHMAVLILTTALAGYTLLHASIYQPIQIWGLWLYVASIFLILIEVLTAELSYKRQQPAA